MRFVLLCGALLCLALPAYAQSNGIGNNSSSQKRTANAKGQPAQLAPTDYLPSISVRLGQIARLLDAKTAEEESAKEDNRAKRNVEAQEDIAYWGKYVFLIAIAELIVTIWGVWLVRRTLLASRADTEDDIRPYVQISRCKFEFAQGRKPRFIARVQNSGQTPATFFEVCFVAKAIQVGEGGAGWVMPDELPNKHIWNALGGSDSVTVGLYQSDLSNVLVDVGFDKKVLFVFGKVRYGDIWRNEYETEFAYWVEKAGPTVVPDGTGSGGVKVEPRKMSRATGTLRTFARTKKA